jgi:hypothetical protein
MKPTKYSGRGFRPETRARAIHVRQSLKRGRRSRRGVNSQVFKRYSQMKLQMKREALEKINRQANEIPPEFGSGFWHRHGSMRSFWHRGTVFAERTLAETHFRR